MPEKINALNLFYRAIEEKVAFVPGEVFYPESARRTNTMRINFSFPAKGQIVEGVKRLAAVMTEHQSSARP